MSLDSEPILDCYITPGILAIIVVVVVASVVIAYFIATACVRAWFKKYPTYMYCAQCNQFMGSLNVGIRPHVLQGNMYGDPNLHINHNNLQSFHDVPDVRVNESDHNERPPTGTLQRLGMTLSKSNRSTTFANLESHALSPIQTSPLDKRSATSGMELLTPTPNLPKYVNEPQPRAFPSSVKTSRRSTESTPNDPSSKKAATPTPGPSSGKAGPHPASGSSKSVQTVNSIMHSHGHPESECLSEADSVFYENGADGGGCSHPRELSKMSQVRILASPPRTGDFSKHPGALTTKTPANANKSFRNIQSKSCEPQMSGRNQLTSFNHNLIRSDARHSVRSQGSGKSRRSLMSRKLQLVGEDRRPKNSKGTKYDPLINQNPTNTEESSCVSEEEQPLQNSNLKANAGATQNRVTADEMLLNSHLGDNASERDTDNNLKENIESKNTSSEAIKKEIWGSPGISIQQYLVDIDITGPPTSVSTDNPINQFESTEPICESCNLGSCRTHEANNITSEVKGDIRGESGLRDNIQNELSRNDNVTKSMPPTGQKFDTKPKVRTSSSARKQKAKYLGKRPGFTESDITSQSEDERPMSRLLSLRRNHLAGMSQSEEDENTRNNQAQRDASKTPSQSPLYPVQASKYVTTKRGTPTPSSVPICTPKFVTVRQKDDNPNTSNYPPNSWDSKQEFVNHHAPNFPPNSWDPINNQELETNRPLNLSANSGHNLSNSGVNNNLSVTAMDNSTPAEGNHTSSPHSSVHIFKPVDLSIPGLDVSLQLSQNQDTVDSERSKLPTPIGTSPAFIEDGRYRHPLNNTMRLPLASVENASNLVDENSVSFHDVTQAGVAENISSPLDVRWPGGKSRHTENSTGSVSSQNYKFILNQESSRLSQDTSRGVSLDSTSTLVPSPANHNNRNPIQVLSPQTLDVFQSQSVPSPQYSRIPRLKDRMQEVKSMPPTTQWSRVKEHALPPSLPPPLPKTRILSVGAPSDQPLDTPGKYGNKTGSNPLVAVKEESGSSAPEECIQEVRSTPHSPHWFMVSQQSFTPSLPPPDLSMPPPPNWSRIRKYSLPPSVPPPALSVPPPPQWSRAKEHTLPPPPLSLPPHAPKTRILSFVQSSYQTTNMSITPEENSANQIGNSLVDVSKESGSVVSDELIQEARPIPPTPQISRVKDQTNPMGLPPLTPTRMSSLGPRSYLLSGTSHEAEENCHTTVSNPSVEVSEALRRQEVWSMPPAPQWSRLKEHALPPSLPPPATKTRILSSSVPFCKESDGTSVSGGHSGVPLPRDSAVDYHRGQIRHGKLSGVSGTPGRSLLPQPNRPQSVMEPTRPSIRQIRTRSSTESSHPPSLAWDSYGSEPTFVPRMEIGFEDYTASESEVDNNNGNAAHNMVYTSDGDSHYYRDNVEVGNEERTLEFQASSYVRSGVRTRSQSQTED